MQPEDSVTLATLGRGAAIERFDGEFKRVLEIDQPKSPFLLRLRKGSKDGDPPSCALFEADGGRWKNEAIKSIKAYLVKALPKNTVILA
jgi:hypothetical protein